MDTCKLNMPARPRQRVTRDEFQIWGNCGYGWDEYCSEDTRREALQRLREYRQNAPGAYELRVKRIRIGTAL